MAAASLASALLSPNRTKGLFHQKPIKYLLDERGESVQLLTLSAEYNYVMGSIKKRKESATIATNRYENFSQLDGFHSWQTDVEDGHINYPVRELRQGKVSYFNFKLAKEMGLISNSHPNKLNKELKDIILKTFSIRIVNEYEESEGIVYHPKVLKKNQYMATRYLQLQHQNKLGETSGDGRCIWNGFVKHKGTTWDVSSRGTGVTALAPGSVLADKPLETGNIDHGYGCGLAEIDELYSSAIMSEIFHNRGITTERMLAIIDFEDGYGIGVRAGTNLFRPAHLFRYLKQNKYESLKQATDYLIQRQCKNGEWDFDPHTHDRFDQMASALAKSYANFLARLERDYIFMWLDWDGDNVLMNAGIIDYGSIRQFGLRHDQYRYDDVDRFSTTLNEQYKKGELTIQVFLQLVDYLKTKKKKPLSSFKRHPQLLKMRKTYKKRLEELLLTQSGIPLELARTCMKSHPKIVKNFYKLSRKLEGIKTYKRASRVDDGVNRPALINLKKALYFVANHTARKDLKRDPIFLEDLFKFCLSEEATGKDLKLRPHIATTLTEFTKSFEKLLRTETLRKDSKAILKKIIKSLKKQISHPFVTGNGLIHLVDELIVKKNSGSSHQDMQKMIDFLIVSQSPKIDREETSQSLSESTKSSFLQLIEDHKESI